MQNSFVIAMIVVSVSGIATAGQAVVEPTALESFVARPTVVVEIDRAIGSLASSDAIREIAALAAAIADLAGIEDGIPALEADTATPWRVQGTGSCWRPTRPMRMLCPGYRIGPEGAGLQLGAYGGPSYFFPGHRPSELTTLLRQAVAALEGL